MPIRGFAVIAFGLALAAVSPSQEEKRLVKGLLLACGQQKLARLEKMYSYGMDFSELSAKAADANCFVLAWGRRSAIVLDLDAAQLGELKFSRDLMGAFLSKADASGTIRMGDLTADEMKSATAFFERTQPNLVGKSQKDLKDFRLGLFTTPEVDLVGDKGARSTHLNLGTNPMTGSKAIEALNAGAFPNPGALSQKERDESAEVGFASYRERSTLIVKALGVALDNFAEGMRELSSLIDSKCRDSQVKTEAVAQKLYEKFGSKLDFGAPDFQSSIEASLNGNWESLGFRSREDAINFMKGAQTQNSKISIGIGWRASPFEGSAGASIVYIVGSFPGKSP